MTPSNRHFYAVVLIPPGKILEDERRRLRTFKLLLLEGAYLFYLKQEEDEP